MSQLNAALDLSYSAVPIASDLLERWAPSVRSRIQNGGKDEVDLTALLFDLWRMNAVINLPIYQRARARQETTPADTWLSSEENRHGIVEGLVSNKKIFAFSVLMRDFNVVSKQQVGAPRSFMLCGVDGELRDGWETIEVVGPENADIPENLDVFGMVYPGRWVSFYGAPYLLAKVLIERLEAELRAFRKASKLLREMGAIPSTKPWPSRKRPQEDTKMVTVPAFVAELDGVEFQGRHPFVGDLNNTSTFDVIRNPPDDIESVSIFTEVIRRRYDYLNSLKFITRATEKAFFDYQILKWFEDVNACREWVRGERRYIRMPVPNWCDEWEPNYRKAPRARTRWARREVGEGISIRFRTWEKQEKVRKNYSEGLTL